MACPMHSVLIIEDALDILLLAQMCLETEGWIVYTAETGALGLAAGRLNRLTSSSWTRAYPIRRGGKFSPNYEPLPRRDGSRSFSSPRVRTPRYQELDLQGSIPKPFNALTLAQELGAFLPDSI